MTPMKMTYINSDTPKNKIKNPNPYMKFKNKMARHFFLVMEHESNRATQFF
jgi:hypothetical protein